MSYDTPAPEAESGKPTDPDTPVKGEDLDPEGSAQRSDGKSESPPKPQP